MSDTDRPLRSPFASFLPGKLWPDNMGVHINAHGGGLLFHEGVYYWYGEHKIAGEAGNRAHVGVHVYASTDLYNWRDEGVALAVSDDPESPITKECVLERPKVIHNVRTATFVMWFHLELKGQGYNAALAAVAVSDSPTGPFRFVAAFRPNAGQWPANVPEEMRSVPEPDRVQETSSEAPNPEARQQNILGRDLEGGQMSRDQTLFVDDDGSAYHLTASEENSTLHISRLTDDYLAPSGDYVRVFERRWMEAPAVCKRQGTYYFIGSGCTGWAPNAARSAVADSLFGPWTELENPCVGINPGNGLGPEKTFGAQSTYILKVEGRDDLYIAIFDIWCPKDAIDGRYVWLPMHFSEGGFTIEWQDEWGV